MAQVSFPPQGTSDQEGFPPVNYSVLDEHCTATALNRSTSVNPDGTFTLPNLPAGSPLARVRVVCDVNGQQYSGTSEFFGVEAGGTSGLGIIRLGPPQPALQSLTVTALPTSLTAVGATAQLAVVATFGDNRTRDVTASTEGSTYISSNGKVATVSSEGVVTAAASGTVIVSVFNDGVVGSTRITVSVDNDTDGDGLPNDYEARSPCLNPNVPNGSLDVDGDGLTNLQEFALGTDPCSPDTDGDMLGDGLEVQRGTNPTNPDSDGDGLIDGKEPTCFGVVTALTVDSDGGCLSDGIEARLGLQPCFPFDDNGDSDGDGILNCDEVAIHTDPGNPDTDGDGIPDGEEVVAGADGFITDPLSADTDGDGASDSVEVNSGCLNPTDPTDLDRDQDQDGVSSRAELAAGTPPCNLIVVAVNPPDGTVDVPLGAQVVLNFLNPVNPSTINSDSIALLAGGQVISASLTRSFDNRTVSIVPSSPLPPNTIHTVVVTTDVTDVRGNALSHEVRSQFTTQSGPDTSAPRVALVRPPDGASGVPVDHSVSLFFTEPLNPDSVPLGAHLRTFFSNDTPDQTATLAGGDAAVVIKPTAPLIPNTFYRVDVDGNVTDRVGNGAASFASTFTTAPDPATAAPQVIAISPNNGATTVPLNARVHLRFSEPIDANTLGFDTFQLFDLTAGTLVSGTPGLDLTGTVATFVPSADLAASHSFQVMVSSVVRDLTGTQLFAFFSSFQTGSARDNVAPAVEATTPSAGAMGVAVNVPVRARFSESIDSVAVTAASFAVRDPNGALVPCSITFSADDRLVTFTPLQPLAPNTNHSLTIEPTVVDLAGNSVVGAPVLVPFTTGPGVDVISPQVTDVSPPTGTANVPVNAVVRVEFSEPMDPLSFDSQTVTLIQDSDNNQVPITVSLDVSGRALTIVPARPLFAGTHHRLQVASAVTDIVGNRLHQGDFESAFFSDFTVTFVSDSTPPAVLATAPANGAGDVPLNVLLRALFSEPIDPVSVTAGSVTLSGPSGPVAGTPTLSGLELTFIPNAPLTPATAYTLTIADTLADFAGNTLAAPATASFTTGQTVDLKALTVVATSPANGQQNVSLNAVVAVQFSEPVEPLTIRADTIQLTANDSGRQVAATLAVDASGAILTVTPTTPLAPFVRYDFRVRTAVTDRAGNGLNQGRFASDFTASFVTGSATDATPPTVAVSPPNAATNVALNAVVVAVFSEPVQPLSAAPFVVQRNGGAVVPGAFSLDGTGTVAAFVPAAPLTASTTYTVMLSNFRDSTGNLLAPVITTFTTSAGGATDTVPPTVLTVAPLDGATGVATNAHPQVCFSEPVNPATLTPNTFLLTNAQGGPLNVPGTITHNADATCATFTPVRPLACDALHGLRVTTGVRDRTGNQLSRGTFAGDFTSSFRTAGCEDTAPPQVVAITPPDGATGVPPGTAIVIAFSEPLNPLTVNANTAVVFAGDEQLAPSISRSDDGTMVTLTVQLRAGVRHTVFVTSDVTDLAGNAAEPFVSVFDVASAADLLGPQVVAVRPPNGATDVPVDHSVSLFFTEPLPAATVASGVYLVGNGLLVPHTTTVGSGGDTVVLAPAGLLTADTLHQVFVTASVTDPIGNPAQPFSSTFRTARDAETAAPQVIAVSPSSSAIDVPVNARMRVRFSEPMDPATITASTVQLLDCTDAPFSCPQVPAALMLDASETVVTIVPAADLRLHGSYQISLPAPGVADPSGTPLGSNFSAGFQTSGTRDDVLPELDTTTPATGATGVPVNASIRARFSKPIDPVSVTATSFLVHDAVGALVPCQITLSQDNRTVTFTPLRPLVANTAHTLTVTSGLTDVVGHAVVGAPVVVDFTSGPGADVTGPQVDHVSPIPGAVGVATNTVIRAEFTEPLDRLTVNAQTVVLTQDIDNMQVPLTLALDAAARVLTVTPARPLYVGVHHQLRLSSALTDVAGNPLTLGSFVGDFVSDFTVAFAADTTAPQVVATTPANGAINVARNTTIQVRFTEALDAVSVNLATLGLTGPGGPVSGTTTVQGAVASFIPATPLAAQSTYSLTIASAIRDVAGNPLGTPLAVSFITAAGIDVIGPQVAAIIPANGQIGVPLNAVVLVQLSEALDPLTVRTDSVTLRRSDSGQMVPVVLSLEDGGSLLRIVSMAPLNAFTPYTVFLSSMVADRAGNPLMQGGFTSGFSSNFSTGGATDPIAPTVIGLSPANGATDAPVNTAVVVAFSEPVTTLSSELVSVTSAGMPVAGSNSVDDTGTLFTFTPAGSLAVGTTYTVTIADARDAAGNALVPLPFVGQFTTSPSGATDTTSPQGLTVVPANGATEVSTATTVQVCFSEPINPATVTTRSFMISDSNQLIPSTTIAVSADGLCATLTPLHALTAGVRYDVRVSSRVRDRAGNPLQQGQFGGDFTSFFITAAAADTTAPQVVSMTPPDHATGVSLGTQVVIAFSEPLNLATVSSLTVAVFAGGTPASVASINHSADGTMIILIVNLQVGVHYTVVVTAGVTDLAGNPAVPFESTFDTADLPDTASPQVVFIRPPNGATGVPVDEVVSLLFNEPLNPATVPGGIVLAGNGLVVPITVDIGDGNDNVVVVPNAPLSPGTLHQTLVTAAVTDVVGNTVQPFTSTFRTAPDPTTVAPMVVAVNPNNGTTGVAVNTRVRVRFSEPIDPATVSFTTVQLLDCTDGPFSCPAVSGSVLLDATGTVATITPNDDLRGQGSYQISLPSPGVTDETGTPLGSNFLVTFQTGSGRDDTVPVIEATSPMAGATGIPVNAPIRARFSKPMDTVAVTADSFAVHDGAGALVPCTIILSNDGRTVTFTPLRPLAANAAHTLTVTAALTDLAGHAVFGAPVNVGFTTGTRVDALAPQVTTTSPSNGAVQVAINARPQLRFSEPMDPTSINTFTIQLLDCTDGPFQCPAIAASITLDASGRVATIVPSTDLRQLGSYQIFASSDAQDVAGNRLPGSFSATFQTTDARDDTAPTVVATTPANAATGVALNASVRVLFTEPIDPVSATAISLSGPEGILSGTLTFNGALLTFTPTRLLNAAATYTLGIGATVADLAGNPLGMPVTVQFTTSSAGIDVVPPFVLSVSPPNGAGDVSQTTVVVAQFSEPVDPLTVSSATVTLTANGGGVVDAQRTLDASGTILQLVPTLPLLSQTAYEFRVRTAVTDRTGNGLIQGQFQSDFVSTFFTALGTPTPTPTRTETRTPTATRTPRDTPTPCMTPCTVAVCGNGVTDGDEECDDGGTCVGGLDAGAHCSAEADCQGDGVCTGGVKASSPCVDDSECLGAPCMHCLPQGGDGCAANCTTESDVSFQLKPGATIGGATILPGTSGATVQGEALAIPLPLNGSQTFTIGKQRDGIIPAVIKAASVQFPKIPIQLLACACLRGVALKTCGGTTFNRDGTMAQDCTPGYSNFGDAANDGPCPDGKPCTFVHGPGNSATGIVGCDGLDGIDFSVSQDDLPAATACAVDVQCPATNACIADPNTPGARFCAPFAPVLTVSGNGPPGSALVLSSIAIGTQLGSCSATFCSDADPFAVRGAIIPLALTTGTAAGEWMNANGTPDNTICNCQGGDFACSASNCISPVIVSGAPVSCNALMQGSASGAALAGSFTAPHVATVLDSVITTVLVAQ